MITATGVAAPFDAARRPGGGLPLRELTPTEREYIAKRDRGGRRAFRFFGFLNVAALIYFNIDAVRSWNGPGPTPWLMYGGIVFFNLMFLSGVFFFLTEGLRRGAKADDAGPWSKVGRHGGAHVVTGMPVRHQLGDVTVWLPDGWSGPPHFGLGQFAAVELTPSLDEDPDPATPRTVLSAVDGNARRVLAVDPALVGTPAL